jgi:hypothetical protein
VKHPIEVDRSLVAAAEAALDYAYTRLQEIEHDHTHTNFRLLTDIRDRCRAELVVVEAVATVELVQARHERLKAESDLMGYTMLKDGEHVLEGHEVYTFDPERGCLAWCAVGEDHYLCGRKWSPEKYMPVRYRK